MVEEPGRTVVLLAGEIDVALRAHASLALSTALRRDLPVVVDAAGVTFADSGGIAFLIQFRALGSEGLDVTFRALPPAIVDVLDILGVRDEFACAA
ncbi:STAS domain-containing protein [Luteimicrobium sp. NPDC057192]|uniref:STAS domain-containing protein n=1 Tax=Luteimicrobium sp. NPDC057192 TaxID=3346042 RepID=UPI003641C29A